MPRKHVRVLAKLADVVEAGVPVVHFNLGYWDWHGDNFTAGRQQIPMDRCAVEDLDAPYAAQFAPCGPHQSANGLSRR